MASEVLEYVSFWKRKLDKYPHEEDIALRALQKLTKVSVTSDVLEATHAAKTIRNLSKRNDEVGEKAKILLNKWTNIIVNLQSPKNSKQKSTDKRDNGEESSSKSKLTRENVSCHEKISSHKQKEQHKKSPLHHSSSKQSSEKQRKVSHSSNTSLDELGKKMFYLNDVSLQRCIEDSDMFNPDESGKKLFYLKDMSSQQSIDYDMFNPDIFDPDESVQKIFYLKDVSSQQSVEGNDVFNSESPKISDDHDGDKRKSPSSNKSSLKRKLPTEEKLKEYVNSDAKKIKHSHHSSSDDKKKKKRNTALDKDESFSDRSVKKEKSSSSHSVKQSSSSHSVKQSSSSHSVKQSSSSQSIKQSSPSQSVKQSSSSQSVKQSSSSQSVKQSSSSQSIKQSSSSQSVKQSSSSHSVKTSSSSHSKKEKSDSSKKEKSDSSKKEKSDSSKKEKSDSSRKEKSDSSKKEKSDSSKKEKSDSLKKEKSDSSKKSADSKTKSKASKEPFDGFTAQSVSFEDCLGFNDIVTVKKKKSSKSQPSAKEHHSPSVHSQSKSVDKKKSHSSSDKKVIDKNNTSKTPKKEKLSQNTPEKSTMFPTPKVISSPNSAVQPTFKSSSHNQSSSSSKKESISVEDVIKFTSSRKEKTAIYSGRKSSIRIFPTLAQCCYRVLIENIDILGDMGDTPYDLLKPILEKCTPVQLFNIEKYNPHLLYDTNEIWEIHCKRDYKLLSPLEHETWRDVYLRGFDEHERRFKNITANICASIDRAPKARQVKLAFIDTYVKPPREVLRRQAKHGLLESSTSVIKPSKSNEVPPKASSKKIESASSSSATNQTSAKKDKTKTNKSSVTESPNNLPSSKGSSTKPVAALVDPTASDKDIVALSLAAKKPKVAPLMAKSLKTLKQCFRR